MISPLVRNSVVLRVLVAFSALAAAAVSHAQNATVTAANAANDAIYNVTFSGGSGSTTVLNTDGGSLHHIVSLVFVPNSATFALDLLAADNQGGMIVRYAGDFHSGDPTTGTPIPFNGTGPAYPDGLSVDSAGDLYVVNSAPGGGNSHPQLWFFQSDGMGGFETPVPIDESYPSKDTLVDTLVVASTAPATGAAAVSAGDVLVAVSGSPSVVLRYPGGTGPAQTLVTLPAGAQPGGIAFWPPDNSLLVTTTTGIIYQYHQLTPAEIPGKFASGLGNGQFKVRTGVQSGVAYAYVANNNGGDILRFDTPGQPPDAIVTAGVQHPQGLAVTNIAYQPLSTCPPTGCDLFGGGVITHIVPPGVPVSGDSIVEDICVKDIDPRLLPPAPGQPAPTSCTTDLPISTVCGNISSTAVIPAAFCGASGPSGKGFALILTKTTIDQNPDTFSGFLVGNASNLPNVLPPPLGGQNPICTPPSPNPLGIAPLGTLLWAPSSKKEGVIPEVNAQGNDYLVDVSDGCDYVTGHTTALSIFGVGFAFNNATNLTSVTNTQKYQNVVATINGESGEGALLSPNTPPPVIEPPVAAQPDGTFTHQLLQCVATSQAAFNAGATDGAANDALQGVQEVLANISQFQPNTDYPNPSGAVIWRLQNIYYTINTRINLQQAAALPPSFPPALQSPTITGKPTTSIVAGSLYSFSPVAKTYWGSPSPNNNLTFSIVGLPTWATFNTTSGLLSGTAVQGTYSGIVITVTDGCASASLPAFSITVSANTKKGGGGDDHDH